ncbi:MAG: GAF domain-containing protein [Polyangiaceae bacterium]|nr:GAF domain-containing protein [Polyangiaceae bacterium]NUQ78159.1 GAF domain-containing protein [Polyangiaceae bacterium]
MAELNDPLRLNQLDGAVLDKAPDEVLNACVREAAEKAGAPIALISVVMRRIQLFRAWFGLPPELSISRATSRCESFCQFVVRTEGPFIVTNAETDLRVPQDLVHRYGIQAYAGVPLRYGPHILGSLCVIDVKPRSFDPAVIATLEGIAERVVERLGVLREIQAPERLPKLSDTEARAALSDLLRDSVVVERALREIDAILRAASGIDAARAASELERSFAGIHKDIALLYNELFEQLRAMRESALRLAAWLGGDGAGSLEQGARTLSRALVEVEPLVRLIEAFVEEGSIEAEAFARNASVLREALDFDRDLVTALRDIKEAGGKALAALELATPPAIGGAGGAA